jgi:hypothetical protein
LQGARKREQAFGLRHREARPGPTRIYLSRRAGRGRQGRSPTGNSEIEIAAGDTWGLMVTPDDEAMPLQVY